MKRTLLLTFVGALLLSACGGAEATPPPTSGPEALVVPPRQPQQLKATDTYGPLVVRTGEFEGAASRKPWSAWWYPLSDRQIFAGIGEEPGPLQKFDQYARKAHNRSTAAAEWEEKHVYASNSSSWEGHCHAWAVASIAEPEPIDSKEIAGIHFNVGDFKALLIKSYEYADNTDVFGEAFIGNGESQYNDIYPDQFHKLIQKILIDQQQAMILDTEPGDSMWSTPIFQAQIKITEDPTNPRVRHVSTAVLGARPFVDTYDFVGTLEVVNEYTYDLYGLPQVDGSFHVKYGEWTGDSVKFHPDFVITVPQDPSAARARHNGNRELDLELVNEILSQAPVRLAQSN